MQFHKKDFTTFELLQNLDLSNGGFWVVEQLEHPIQYIVDANAVGEKRSSLTEENMNKGICGSLEPKHET